MRRYVTFITAAWCILLLATSASGREAMDMTGRLVRTPEKLERIVSPYRVATAILLILGEHERIVSISIPASPVAQKLFPGLKKAGIANRHSSVEEILKMKPDLVITSPGKLVTDLEAAGIPVFCIVVEDPESLVRGIEAVAALLGHEERAREVGAYYRGKIDFIARQTAGIEQKKKVYLAGPTMLTAVAGDFYQDRIIPLAGGVNVSHEGRGGWVSVSREHLLSWNPEVILTLPYYNPRLKEEFLSDPSLKSIPAISKQRVYVFPSYLDSWDMPMPESILGIMWLSTLLYPGQVYFDMEKEAREFYLRFYGSYPEPITLTEVGEG